MVFQGPLDLAFTLEIQYCQQGLSNNSKKTNSTYKTNPAVIAKQSKRAKYRYITLLYHECNSATVAKTGIQHCHNYSGQMAGGDMVKQFNSDTNHMVTYVTLSQLLWTEGWRGYGETIQ